MKFLIIKTSSLGDIVHCFDALSYLHRKFPDATIDWVAEKPFAELLQSHPFINHVFTIDSKTWRKNLFKISTWQEIKKCRELLGTHKYDVVFDFQGNIKSGLVCYHTKATAKIGFGKKSVPEKPNLLFTDFKFDPPQGNNIRNDYLFLVTSFFKGESTTLSDATPLKINNHKPEIFENLRRFFNQHPKIMICPGSAWPNKQLKAPDLALLISHIKCRTQGKFVLVWGTQDEKRLVEHLQEQFPSDSIVLEKMPLPHLQNLMQEMDWIIAMDSLPLHLAGTTSASVFSVFGASLGSKYAPIGPNKFYFQGVCPFQQKFEKRCSILRTCASGACINDIDHKKLIQAFDLALENKKTVRG